MQLLHHGLKQHQPLQVQLFLFLIMKASEHHSRTFQENGLW